MVMVMVTNGNYWYLKFMVKGKAFFRSSGIQRILDDCHLHNLPEPEFEVHGQTFRAIFRPAKGVTRPQAESGVQLPTQSATQSTDPVARLLTCLAQGEMSSRELRSALGIKHRPTFRKNYLHPALEAALIAYTLPDKPQSRLQKYRLTDKGRKRLTENR